MKPILTSLLLLTAAVRLAAETPVEQVARQFREYCLRESTDRGERLLDDVELPKTSPEQAHRLLGKLREDGSWPDIDYLSAARSDWPPCNQLTRTLGLVVFALRPETSASDRTNCLAASHRALAYWRRHDFQCANWWYNQIGVPKILGDVALLLGDDLSPDERNYIAGTVLARSKVGSMTGQNRIWLAANGVMRAVLTGDETLMNQAAEVIQDELRVGTGEGIQPDWSFHQHGPQQQFGNYGMACAVEMSRWATVLRGTPWAFSSDKMNILRGFLLNGENWVCWQGMMDVSACGRQLFPHSPWSKAGVMRGVMRAMTKADASHAGDYLAFVARNQTGAINDLVGNRYFWRSDYLIHRRPGWMMSLKMSSQGVVGGETVNSENLSGHLLADGAMYFYRTGHEYDDIFPVWDWHLIPGITICLGKESVHWSKEDRKTAATFVGGVSDGTNACAAMDFQRDSVRARKSWFFTGDIVVCLGSGICSTGDQRVVTIINQCLLQSPVIVWRGDQREPVNGSNRDLAGAKWVEQDGLRYTPLEPEQLWLDADRQTGNWNQVFTTPTTPKTDISKDVFTLWIEHGTNVNNGHYAYSVAPADTIDRPALEILSNTRNLQAVSIGADGHRSIGSVFWKAGSANLDGREVKVDAPCLLLMDQARVFVSDPTQKLAVLRVEIGHKSTTVSLPSGGDAGKSVEISGLE